MALAVILNSKVTDAYHDSEMEDRGIKSVRIVAAWTHFFKLGTAEWPPPSLRLAAKKGVQTYPRNACVHRFPEAGLDGGLPLSRQGSA